MLQSQYFSNGLTNTQIERVLNNYRIKYTTIKSEIERKINIMFDLFLKDILTFLEHVEQIASDKDKINDYDRLYKEKELLLTTITEKNTRISTLNEENKLLKEQIQCKMKFLSKQTSTTNVNMNNNSKRCSPVKQKNVTFNYSEYTTPCSYAMKYKSTSKKKKQSSLKGNYSNTARNMSLSISNSGNDTLFSRNEFELYKNLSQELSMRGSDNNSSGVYIQTAQSSNEGKINKHKGKQRSCKDIMKFVNGKNNNSNCGKDNNNNKSEINEMTMCLNEYDNLLKEEISLLNDEEYLITKIINERNNNNNINL